MLNKGKGGKAGKWEKDNSAAKTLSAKIFSESACGVLFEVYCQRFSPVSVRLAGFVAGEEKSVLWVENFRGCRLTIV